MFRKILACLLLGSMITGGIPVHGEKKDYRSSYSTWVWRTYQIVNHQEELFRELEAKRVQKVYLQVNRDIPKEEYRAFIQKASAKGMDVYALEGSPSWIEADNNRASLFKSWLQKYQKEAGPSQEFTGIHLDAEPHAHAMWDTNQQTAITRYQAIIKSFRKKAADLNLPLESDLPFWFDGVSYDNKYGKGRLSDWVIRNTDAVTILAYRNFVEGQNGIIPLIEHELEYAHNMNKKVEVGVETKDMTPDYLTFFELGQNQMNNVFGKVATHYSNVFSFNGFAVHEFNSWQEIKSDPISYEKDNYILYKSKKNVGEDHNWVIQLNTELDENSINSKTVYVKKANGEKVEVSVNLKSADRIVVQPPNGGYEKGESYTLFISNEVLSTQGKKLKNSVFMPFLIKK
ncbi:hypothetical protein [Pontibacillus yanchengensis]|uniref:SbsA Ig-like domain-containing protein n=1 Tax=Pontibacillus yanchengensis Y32 TaxID=1385514 RepID=A0A0A2TFR9_9BACI|nr:hypothetical protein [Pontibacillus yanchengensis]KGP74702.1 hypothetical protein N782_00675 [Pontibacillus yanchengensis Y32]